jgi:hypothetical protein
LTRRPERPARKENHNMTHIIRSPAGVNPDPADTAAAADFQLKG